MSKYYYHPVTGEKVVVEKPIDCVFCEYGGVDNFTCGLRRALGQKGIRLCKGQKMRYDLGFIDCPLKDVENEAT